LRCRRLRISSPSRHSARTVRRKRFALAFACGAGTGVFTTRTPPLRNTSSTGRCTCCRGRESGHERTAQRSRGRDCVPAESPRRRSGWPCSLPARRAARMRDEEQHVVAAKEDAVDGEEVAGDDAPRLSAPESAPAWPRAPRRRPSRVWESRRRMLVGDAWTPSFASSPQIRHGPNVGSPARAAGPAAQRQPTAAAARADQLPVATSDAQASDANAEASGESPRARPRDERGR
jgi:hypothetical protein